jgi:cobyrinic acid a,c-diamide synthase
MKALLVAAPHSGAGKTSISLALMAALRRRGHRVQAFKVGPDFIDPGHHALATGKPSHNLDGWMLSPKENLAIFQRHSQGADLCIVEGVMGLFDGFSGDSDQGSSAQMAKLLGLPVLLTINARAMARSLAALALGFVSFDPELSWAGLIANKVGSEAHADMLRQAMQSVPQLPMLGALHRNADIAMPERHLGLITAEEGGFDQAALDRLADWLEQGVDLDALLSALPEVAQSAGPCPHESRPIRARLAVARDQAFCFYYPENLRRLEQAGAKLLFFSPVNRDSLPNGADGLYLGGGYPELYAQSLAANDTLRQQVAEMAQAGKPIYAECGGMMFLGRELEDLEGRTWPMAGVLPFKSRMLSRLKRLGYREIVTRHNTCLGPSGTRARGHEFHYSELVDLEHTPGFSDQAYEASGRKGPMPGTQGFSQGNTLASYVHLHFGSNPELAGSLVRACSRAGDMG